VEEDDAVTVHFGADMLDSLATARAFVDYEADLLDRLAYDEWLGLWEEDGRYIMPIERGEIDYRDVLNHIYDDATMRRQRVHRLLSGHAPAADPVMRTVRTVSRVRLMEANEGELVVASSLLIISFRRQIQTLLAADVTHRLALSGQGIRLREKLVRLINSDEPLPELSFIA
jgi:3-phenylpropionate/cinnamic acid dioxygenase small subunit